MQTLNEDILEYNQGDEYDSYMNPKMLNYFKQKLINWKNKLIEESKNEQNLVVSKSVREPDHVDEAALEQDRKVDFFILDRDLNLMNEIDEALIRITKGEYGYCEETGDKIGIKRLDAWPIARLTVYAQERKEKNA